ncbi:MAG: nitroreductase family protein [Chloroflexi bacterium]|nr:nitroreductase family protein [Chloroflexota bacterium]
MSSSGHPRLSLTPDEVLTTTRSVRKRLDLTRPVERSVIEECLRIAQQAPSASNRQHWHFLVVTDPAKKAALGDLYLKARQGTFASRTNRVFKSDAARETYQRVAASADYLADKMGEVPVLVIPAIEGRVEQLPFAGQAALWGTILPAAWSFMLAARARGLGSVWTTIHLNYEREAAEILGIPYEQVTQAAMIPLAYTIGTDFKLAQRDPLESMVHWDTW